MTLDVVTDGPGASSLTSREKEIVRRLRSGDRVPAIAAALGITQSTVRNHLYACYLKLGVRSQQELITLLRGSEHFRVVVGDLAHLGRAADAPGRVVCAADLPAPAGCRVYVPGLLVREAVCRACLAALNDPPPTGSVVKTAHAMRLAEVLAASAPASLPWPWGGDIRTESVRRAADAEAAAARERAGHARNLAAAGPLVRPYLELHGPEFPPYGGGPVCGGCDWQGYKGEPPDFPCRTYDLALSQIAEVVGQAASSTTQ